MYTYNTWNYSDEDIFRALKQSEVFEELKAHIDDGFFENVLKERVLENPHKTILTMVPRKGLAEAEEKELSDKLKAYKESLSDAEIESLIKDTKELREYQDAEDTPEAIASIPTLSLKDISKKGRTFEYEEKELGGIKNIVKEQFTNGIAYAIFSFSFKNMPKRLLKYLALLKAYLGVVDTKNYKYSDLINEVGIYTGSLSFTTNVYKHVSDPDVYDPAFEVRFKTLYKNLDKTFELMKEILFTSKYDDKKHLKDILEESRSRLVSTLASSGDGVSYKRLLSYLDKGAVINEEVSGMDAFRYLEYLCDNFDSEYDDIVKGMKDVLDCVLSKENLTVSISAEKDGIEAFNKECSEFLKNIPSKNSVNESYNIDLKKKQEAFTYAAQVQFVGMGENFARKGLKYDGSLQVLRNLLSSSYLWNEVRVKGGAYGVYALFQTNGNMFFQSYRDPGIAKTIEAYKGACEYVKNYPDDEDTIERTVISTIGLIDTPYTPSIVSIKCFNMYKTGLTNEMSEKERTEILNTNCGKIRDMAKYLEIFGDDAGIVCVGGNKAISESSELFLKTEPLYNS